MARMIIGLDSYQPKPTYINPPFKYVARGRPSKAGMAVAPPGKNHGKGKGGVEKRPTYHVAGDYAVHFTASKRRMLLNVVADAANRHGVAIPFMEKAGKVGEMADLRSFISMLDMEEAKERNAKTRNLPEPKHGERVPLTGFDGRHARSLFCGHCGNITADEITEYSYHQHATGCQRKASIWVDLMQDPEFAARQHKAKANKDALWAAIKAHDDKATNAKPSTVVDKTSASDEALAAAGARGGRVWIQRAEE